MSHELRTPMNSIIGFTGILLMGMAGELNHEQKKQLGMVKNSAEHLLSLINEILDISKIEAGKIKVSCQEFRFDELVREVLETLSPIAGQKDLRFIADVPNDITCITDKKRLKQILMNLMNNAVKFTDQGHVNITAKLMENEILEVLVSDTGIGIKKEDMHRLFHPFQQVDICLTKKYEGTGLGLYLCQKIVGLLGGHISAKSEYGKGSEFTFTLPLKYTGEI